jgi:hypothetical protein
MQSACRRCRYVRSLGVMKLTPQPIAEPAIDPSAPPMRYPNRFRPGQSANPLGRRSPIERARALAVDRQKLFEELIGELAARLGRKPGRAELLLVEAAAQQAIEGRELRKKGRSSAEPDRLLGRLIGMLGLSARSAEPVRVDTLRERLLDGEAAE